MWNIESHGLACLRQCRAYREEYDEKESHEASRHDAPSFHLLHT
jgi:hypothetical protein